MTDLQVIAERRIGAPADRVYRLLTDYRAHHPCFLPPTFSDFRVEEGGIGAGTVHSFKLRAGGRTRTFRMRVRTEPGRVVTESDQLSSAVTTFTVTPDGSSCRVRIETRWQGATGLRGLFERLFAPWMLRRIYMDELARLDSYAHSENASRLLPEPVIPSSRPLQYGEPDVLWLQQSADPEAVAVRNRVNTWYSEFPDSNGYMAAKLQSSVNETFHSALDELYVHHLLRQIEPDVRYEEGGQGEPDFRVYRGGRQILVVEVLSLFVQQEWDREERRHGRLVDELNKRLQSQGYLLRVEVGLEQQNVPERQFARFADQFVSRLPAPEATSAAYQAGNPLPTADFIRPGIHVRLQARPMNPRAAASPRPGDRIASIGAAIGGPVKSHEWLRQRLEAKSAGRYSRLTGVPFVIAVGNHDTYCLRPELMVGIYGADWERVGTGLPRLNQDPNLRGFFGIGWSGEPPRNTPVSAVAVINAPTSTYPPDSPECLVFHNPHADVPLPDALFPATNRFGPSNSGPWAWRPPLTIW